MDTHTYKVTGQEQYHTMLFTQMHTDAQTDRNIQTDIQMQTDTQTDRCRLTHRQTQTDTQTDRQTKGIHAITNGSTGKGTVVMTTMQAGCVILIINGTLVCEAKEFVIHYIGGRTHRKNIKKQRNSIYKLYLLKTSTYKTLFRYIYTYTCRTPLKLLDKKTKETYYI